jgi:aspartyl-tRNA(Asn)/glutamyl-tRNA(Gln) amidotransferase subunit A
MLSANKKQTKHTIEFQFARPTAETEVSLYFTSRLFTVAVTKMQPMKCDRREFLATTTIAAAGMVLKPTFAPPSDFRNLTLKEASELVRRKAVSPVELTEACLKRISTYNRSLNAFITVTADQAMESARAMEVEQRRGRWRGPLHGIPLALKDNIDTAGIRTTAASELFKERVPSADAEVVRRLKNAGAILLGKTNLHEFAYGGSSSVSYFGPVHNPWAFDRVSGGSSGGSAAATASELCFGSLGTDTAGSIRIPASYCGIVGFKPSYGRVSNRGVVPLSWTLDHVGPLCRSVEDTAIMLSVIAGYDELEPSSVEMPVPDYRNASTVQVSKLRLGIPRSPFFEGLDADIAKAVEAAIALLRKVAPEVSDVTLPAVDISMDEIYARVRGVEAYTYHSRWIAESPEKYQPSTRERVENGARVKAEDYVQARRDIDLLRREINKTFASFDLLITPTMPTQPVPITQGADPTAVRYRNTVPFDILGVPAISVPCGFTSAGLPVGLEIAGAPFAEPTVFALAQAYERETEWHKRRPKLT